MQKETGRKLLLVKTGHPLLFILWPGLLGKIQD